MPKGHLCAGISNGGKCMTVNVSAINFRMWGAGAMQLMSMQEELQKQVQTGELGEHALEAYLETKQQAMLDNLWKLNVADIELTLSHVCQKVFFTLIIFAVR